MPAEPARSPRRASPGRPLAVSRASKPEEVAMSRIHTLFPVLLAVTAACGGAEKKVESPPPTLSGGDPGVKAVSPSLGVSDEIARQCQLHFDDVSKAPKFDFDASELHPRDRDALEQIGKCLTTGPLRGRAVKLVGRADPRGTT